MSRLSAIFQLLMCRSFFLMTDQGFESRIHPSDVAAVQESVSKFEEWLGSVENAYEAEERS